MQAEAPGHALSCSLAQGASCSLRVEKGSFLCSFLFLQGSIGFPGFPGTNGEKGGRVRETDFAGSASWCLLLLFSQSIFMLPTESSIKPSSGSVLNLVRGGGSLSISFPSIVHIQQSSFQRAQSGRTCLSVPRLILIGATPPALENNCVP